MKYKVAQNEKFGHMTLIGKVGVAGWPRPLVMAALNWYLESRYDFAYEIQSCSVSKVRLYDNDQKSLWLCEKVAMKKSGRLIGENHMAILEWIISKVLLQVLLKPLRGFVVQLCYLLFNIFGSLVGGRKKLHAYLML